VFKAIIASPGKNYKTQPIDVDFNEASVLYLLTA
jgi:hypothetical protein